MSNTSVWFRQILVMRVMLVFLQTHHRREANVTVASVILECISRIKQHWRLLNSFHLFSCCHSQTVPTGRPACVYFFVCVLPPVFLPLHFWGLFTKVALLEVRRRVPSNPEVPLCWSRHTGDWCGTQLFPIIHHLELSYLTTESGDSQRWSFAQSLVVAFSVAYDRKLW